MKVKLMTKRGKIESFESVHGNLFYVNSGKTFIDFNTEDHYRRCVYVEFNQTAILVGYMSKKQLIDNYDYYCFEIDKALPKYVANLHECIVEGSMSSAHEAFTAHFDYINSIFLGKMKESVFETFKVNYQKYLDEKKAESDKAEIVRQEKLKKEEIERVEKIGDLIRADKKVSGRDLLDYINLKNIDVPIKTKGLINRCYDINSEGLYIKNGKKPRTANNVFKWYRTIKEMKND